MRRRTVYVLCAVLLSVVALGSDSPKEYGSETEMEGIEGTWQAVEYEADGDRRKISGESMTFGHVTFIIDHGKMGKERGTYTIRTTSMPRQLDLTFKQVKREVTCMCIYKIDGDTLWIAWGWGRPEDFDKEGICIETYKRVKN